MNRRGFSLVELMTVVALMGLLATIALPKYQMFRKKAVAAEIVAAMNAVRAGAYQFNETAGAWPPSAALGAVPTGLAGYLPGGGTNLFQASDYQLAWFALRIIGFGSTGIQLIYAYVPDGVTCQSVYGLWGGAGNRDLLNLCGGGGGFVFLWVDR